MTEDDRGGAGGSGSSGERIPEGVGVHGSDRDPRLLASLEALIRDAFPLGAFMGVVPRGWDEGGLTLWAPAEPSGNVHGTMFGGGIAALGILTGWGWLRLELEARGRSVPVVVQDARITYARPIEGPCVARCLPPEPERFRRFLQTVDRKGRGRIALRIELGPAMPGSAVGPWGAGAPGAGSPPDGPSSRGGGAPAAGVPAAAAAVVEARFACVPDPTR